MVRVQKSSCFVPLVLRPDNAGGENKVFMPVLLPPAQQLCHQRNNSAHTILDAMKNMARNAFFILIDQNMMAR